MASDWAKLRRSRDLTSANSAENMFSSRRALNSYDSRHISLRESRDSEDSPNSTPIIIGFDVTASMGCLAKELATNGVHKTVTLLLSGGQVPNPQILCSAIGDCKSDASPLQVTQFESDIRIITQLLDLYLEGGGGGNNGESYHLLWYFAAYHTQHDSYARRGKKGFLFTIGDDRCHEGLSAAEIDRTFSDSHPYGLSNAELLREAEKLYHIFHIHIEKGSPADARIFADWCQLLPGRCTTISAGDLDCLAELIATITAIAAGTQPSDALRRLEQRKAERIARSVAAIRPVQPKKAITF